MADTEHPFPGAPVVPGTAKTGNGSTLICTKDPLGFTISLDVHRWEDHIVKRHPEMAGHLDRIRGTIEDPQLIKLSEGSTVAYYYRLTGRAERKANDVYVLVVVDRNEETKSGVVLTAHLLKTIKADEGRIVWLRQQQL
jgi:hypothetical protein